MFEPKGVKVLIHNTGHMLICIFTEVSSTHCEESVLKDEAQVSGLPLN